ncbi:15-hydroxyprostaglandin dehydrogenase [Trichonephila clavipes]|nr:15-hydroxyprostaglandin dehydrogenase [Trichonephila clavipes]
MATDRATRKSPQVEHHCSKVQLRMIEYSRLFVQPVKRLIRIGVNINVVFVDGFIPMRFIKFHIIRPALGLDPFYVSPVYCASKHAVVGFSKSYGHEFHFKQTGVTVNAICPGPVDTGFFRVFPTKCIDVAEAKKLAAKMRPVK